MQQKARRMQALQDLVCHQMAEDHEHRERSITMKAVKLCRDCGRPIKNGSSRRVVCDDCLREKETLRQEEVRSLAKKEKAPRDSKKGKRKKPFKSLDKCAQEDAALGISYGRYVARGLDQV